MRAPAFRPPFLELPSGDLESTSCLRLGLQLQHVIDDASDAAMSHVWAWLDRKPIHRTDFGPFQPQELTHELSEYLAPASTDVFVDGRSLLEYQAMDTLPSLSSLAMYSTFCAALKHLGSSVCGYSMHFRRSEITTIADRRGGRVVYPCPEDLHSALTQLHAYWYHRIHATPGTAAVAILAGLAHLHPFEDGNGRVARAMFNATLNMRRSAPIYLPLYELAALSQCGFLLRLRQAQYHGEWEPLLDFLVRCAGKLLAGRARQ